MAAAVRGLGFGPGAIAGIRTSRPYKELCLRLALARLGIGVAARSLPNRSLSVCLSDGTTPDEPGVRCERFDDFWSGDAPPTTKVPQLQSHQDGAAIFAIFQTSGTTGIPKHVALSHEIAARRLAANSPMAGLAGVVREICTIGTGTTYGLLSRLRVLAGGGVIVMTGAAERIPFLIDRYRVNRLALAPITLQRLLGCLAADSGPSPWLQEVEIGGSALPEALYDIARQRLCANIVTRYGATETGYVASAPIESLRGHVGAVGYIGRRVEVQAVDAEDKPLPPGTEGVLRIRSAGAVDGYFDDPAASKREFRNGWFYPGDIGAIAPDGLLTVTSRASEVINRGGNKVNPQVIEEVLLSVPGIEEAAAFGVPDAQGVTSIWAAIVADQTVDMAAVRVLCRERLRAKAPSAFLRLKQLPRNEFGKALRGQLAKMALASLAR